MADYLSSILRYPTVQGGGGACVVPTGYPSVSPRGGNNVAVLTPLVGHIAGTEIVSVPAAGTENARDILQRLEGHAIPITSESSLDALSRSLAGDVLSNTTSTLVSGGGTYFDELIRVREAAHAVVLDQIKRVRESGGRMTDAEFRELVGKRRAAQELLERWSPPISRYEVLDWGQFQERAKLEAMLRTVPPDRVRQVLDQQYLAMRSRYLAGAWEKSFVVSRAWAKRAAAASGVLVVIDFGPTAIELFTARTKEEADAAAGKLAGQAAGIVAAQLAGWVARVAIGAALGAFLIATPAGWIVAAAGFLVGTAVGIYVQDQVPKFVTPLIEVNPYGPGPTLP